MKTVYEAWYRFGDPPWVGGPRSELVELVESGRLMPGRALDLGCGDSAAVGNTGEEMEVDEVGSTSRNRTGTRERWRCHGPAMGR